ncbi:MAG TPA: PEP-CTERM-box response regulator transcription factor [Pseudomonadales bacterium]|nr:PEP-CTERM-box response regulator transcription factor [Pseudomonadales bacterium]HNF08261.1 PEP-CTERM-box response regulator transcription factor [Pseudomonadales bacterium]HNF73877.1 PEP-CTERM-box response regulator transcription factor [Pseudomonadales bacterium]HNH70352.1 PEP-CTERM-box response regulator transcription factor [Pseudomonadales bacterium]HNL30917.1 PEP-CTERM-box response regulator transcription factor [Pseudomonadales bacterium]
MSSSMELKKILVVEDDPGLQKQLKWSFDDYEVVVAGDREEAIAALRRHEPAVITLDLGLPPDPANASEGLATLAEILQLLPSAKVIVVTGNDERDNAVKAIGMGAYDYYQKPIDPQVLGLIIQRAFHLHALEEENRRLQRGGDRSLTPLAGVIATSPQMVKLCRTVEKLAPTDVTALLLGESGTGKEVLARALHTLSRRQRKPFVAVNCAAIPENLLESELFGYERGAFTGANKQTKGKIEYAQGGTFFLDELGDLPQSLQAKLLRFLQERTIERIGGRELIPVDVRVVCATNKDLKRQVEAGQFREDLYYRVSEVTIDIPPLREREGDAVVIARLLLDRFAEQNSRALKGFTEEALSAIAGHDWPGNIRELENRIKRAVIMADGKWITADDLELESQNREQPKLLNLREARERAETEAIRQALNAVEGNVSRAADTLGVARPTLYHMMEKYGITGTFAE